MSPPLSLQRQDFKRDGGMSLMRSRSRPHAAGYNKHRGRDALHFSGIWMYGLRRHPERDCTMNQLFSSRRSTGLLPLRSPDTPPNPQTQTNCRKVCADSTSQKERPGSDIPSRDHWPSNHASTESSVEASTPGLDGLES